VQLKPTFGYSCPLYATLGRHNDNETENGMVILRKETRVSPTGKAKMWILSTDFFEYHKNRLKVGTKGYFMEGPTITAECEVIELVGLK
jgi:hypothetical protein